MPQQTLLTFPSDLNIVDPHCHFWKFGPDYAWLSNPDSAFLGNITPIAKDYLVSNYLEDAKNVNVTKCIHIEAALSQHAKQEVAWLLGVAKKYPVLQGIIAGADLSSSDVESLLDYCSSIPQVKGIRQILNWHKNPIYCAVDHDNYLTDAGWQKAYKLLAKYNLLFETQLCPDQLPDLAKLAKQHEDVPVVLNHAGFPLPSELNNWRSQLKLLAEIPHVNIKLSGFGMLNHDWTLDSIRDLVLYIIDCFGIDRCMFASNFPVDKLYSSFDHLVRSYYTIVSDFTREEQEKLFSQSAERIYSV